MEYVYKCQQCYPLHHCTAHIFMLFYIKWLLYLYVMDEEVQAEESKQMSFINCASTVLYTSAKSKKSKQPKWLL